MSTRTGTARPVAVGIARSPSSPRTGAASAPVHLEAYATPPTQGRPLSYHGSVLAGQLGTASLPPSPAAGTLLPPTSPLRRRRAQSLGQSPCLRMSARKIFDDAGVGARARDAQRLNDSMIYLDGAGVYSCATCRTHLTSRDDIISKSFHGRHGRAYLFDQCVNVSIGPAEDRLLITGLHSVCDIFCKRCKTCVGWTYQRAYESSQRYKEGKFIIEKINLHLEVSEYGVAPPPGEKLDRWRQRSMSWGSEAASSMVYEYQPSSSA